MMGIELKPMDLTATEEKTGEYWRFCRLSDSCVAEILSGSIHIEQETETGIEIVILEGTEAAEFVAFIRRNTRPTGELSRPQPDGECGDLVEELRRQVEYLNRPGVAIEANFYHVVSAIEKAIAALSRPQSGDEIERLQVLALKHCPKDHHDWEELLELTRGMEKAND